MMKKTILSVLLGMMAAGCCLPAEAQVRERYGLNRGWKTWLVSSNSAQAVLNDTAVVDIPHNWDDYYGYRQLLHGNLHGTAVYRKHFNFPHALKEDQRAFLCLEGVGTYATVTLNGQSLGRYPVGRLCVQVELGNALKQGDNVLEIKAEHPELISDMPNVCGGCSSEWGFSEGSQPLGIFRPIHLEITSEVRVEPFGQFVWNNASGDSLFIETEVRNYAIGPRAVKLQNVVYGPDGKEVFRLPVEPVNLNVRETQTLRQAVSLKEVCPDVMMWSLEHPSLYRLESRLLSSFYAQDVVLDESEQEFGIRTLSWPLNRVHDRDGRFFLNGEPVFINGVCEYEHLLGGGHAFSDAQIAARVKLMRQLGFNAMRDAHCPHNLRYLYHWDHEGMLNWTQLSAHIWYDTPEFREQFKKQLVQWVKERRNSPSVVLWGLQNESTLPEDFARECTELIRQLDPTATVMRPVTTCNGGVGSDWNVVQNWSGTYSDHPENYAEELSQPSQLLNGEYGAWRTMGFHESPEGFVQSGPHTEERYCELLEMKVQLAEKAKNHVCGQFLWILQSHDNPGRTQPDEAYRLIDRVGPVNYKGLLTPWDEPVDGYYMYRANYVSPEEDPMVYISSHTWSDRFASLQPGVRAHVPYLVYSNADSVRLYNDAVCDDKSFVASASLEPFEDRPKGQHFDFGSLSLEYNVLKAQAYYRGKVVAEDCLVFKGLRQAPHFDKLYDVTERQDLIRPAKGYYYVCRVNCGGDNYKDAYGNVWQQDNMALSHSWAGDFEGMNPYQASQRHTDDPISGTRHWALLGHFRFGRQRLSYTLPLPDGRYRLELYFVEPWYGTGGCRDASGLRRFDVAVNGKTRIKNLDIWAEAGHDGALKKCLEVDVRGGRLEISFPKTEVGQAVISAIAVAMQDRQQAAWARAYFKQHLRYPVSKLEEAAAYRLRYLDDWSWKEADTMRMAKLPKEMMPANTSERPSANYAANTLEWQGACSLVQNRGKECVEIGPGAVALRWHFSTGLANVYALRFNYRNLAERDLPVNLRILASDGRLVKEWQLRFPRNDRGWKLVSTTTGDYINAGDYTLEMTGENLEGLYLESLDVQ